MKLFVISDLHLGGRPSSGNDAAAPGGQICRSYPALTRFIDWVAQQGTQQEPVELVINGDIVDFLMEDDYPQESDTLPWLPDEARIIAKLQQIIERTRADAQQAGYGPFDAMAQLLAAGQDLTFILGNHDVELSLPKVRQFLEQQVLLPGRGASVGRFRFCYDGEAYVRGDLLIEHGNRYDPWNMIDHSALRQERSMLSRGLGAQMLERSEGQFAPPPGSLMVTRVINPLKRKYRFVDLLKPEDKAAIPILLALHPKLEFVLKALLQFQSQRANRMENPVQPTRSGHLSSRAALTEFDLAASLELALGPQVAQQFGAIGVKSVPGAGGGGGGGGGAPLSAAQCWDKIKTLSGNIGQWIDDTASLFDQAVAKPQRYPLLRRALQNWRGELALRQDTEAAEYLDAVRELAQTGAFRCIVFGHTHLPKQIDLDQVRYLNTGTWADIMQLPPDVLADGVNDGVNEGLNDGVNAGAATDGPLARFVQDLQHNRIEAYLTRQLCYAELTLQAGPDGETVQSARLCQFEQHGEQHGLAREDEHATVR